MSSTNKTTYYDLPQFVDSDLFNPLDDDNDAYSKIDIALHNIANAEADDASEIVDVKRRVATSEGKIEALETQNGDEALATTAQTLSGAVNELDADIASLGGRVGIVENDINNVNTGLKAKVSALEEDVEPLVEGKYYVTPEMYGAVGNGVADDTTALQNMFDSGYDIIIPKKTYKITHTLYARVNCNIIGYGSILCDGDFTGIVVGNSTPMTGDSGWFIGKEIKLNVTRATPDWVHDISGIVLENVWSAKVHIGVNNFKIGLKLFANNYGCAWNEISSPKIYNCKIGIDMDVSGNGWTNQNTFIGGSIAWYHGTASQYASTQDPCIGITVKNNENSFYNVAVDGQGTQQSDYNLYKGIQCDGNWNNFNNIRLERVGSVDFSGQWNSLIYPYLFTEYTTINKTYANSVAILHNRGNELISEAQQGLKLSVLHDIPILTGINSNGIKTFEVLNNGTVYSANHGMFGDGNAVVTRTSNKDITSDIIESGSYVSHATDGLNGGWGALLGSKRSADEERQYAFGLYDVQTRMKINGTWGNWGKLFPSPNETPKYVKNDWGTQLTITQDGEMPCLLIMTGVSWCEVFILSTSHEYKIYDSTGGATLTHSYDATTKTHSLTASANCRMYALYN